MIKKIILFQVLIFTTLNIFSQTIKVVDKNTLQPIENVMIFTGDNSVFELTDVNGKANIEKMKNFKNIYFQHPGFDKYEISYNIAATAKIIYLTETNIKIGEIVISANKWEQKQSDIPFRITSVKPKQIDFYNPQTSADLLGTTGDVFIQKSQQGGGSPMIRGFATNRLLISVDGVRMNTAIFRSGNLQNIISLDPFTVENTEVFFGPGSVIYGSDAIGGVMSFNTLTPKLSYGDSSVVSGNTAMRFSSANNETTGHFDVNIGWKKWASLTSISYTKYGDLRMGKNGLDDYLRTEYTQRVDTMDIAVKNSDPLVQTPSGYSQTNLMQKIRFKPNKHWNITYAFHYSTTTDYDRYDRLIQYKKDHLKYAEWYYGPQIWMMNNLNIENTSASGIYDKMTIRLTHQYFEESRHKRKFNKTELKHNVEKVNAYSVNFDFHKIITDKQHLFYGLESVFDNINSKGTVENITDNSISQGLPRYPQSDWQSYAAYITYNYKISNKFTLNAGMRYNQFVINAAFDTAYNFPFGDAYLNNGALTGSLGAVWHPAEKLWIKTNASTGFRAPNIDDMGKVFDSGEGVVVVPNPDLGTEYAYNIDFGITQIINDMFEYDITVYYTYLNNALVRRDFQIDGQDSIVYDGEISKVEAVQNAAKAQVYGIQAEIDINLSAGFKFISKYNYQKGTEETDNGETSPSRHAAPMFGASHLTYTNKKFMFDLYAIYTGKVSYNNLSFAERDKPTNYAKDENGNPYAPSWTTINFNAGYQFNRYFSVTAAIENITDKRYRPYASGISAAGRNFMISVRARF